MTEVIKLQIQETPHVQSRINTRKITSRERTVHCPKTKDGEECPKAGGEIHSCSPGKETVRLTESSQKQRKPKGNGAASSKGWGEENYQL